MLFILSLWRMYLIVRWNHKLDVTNDFKMITRYAYFFENMSAVDNGFRCIPILNINVQVQSGNIW